MKLINYPQYRTLILKSGSNGLARGLWRNNKRGLCIAAILGIFIGQAFGASPVERAPTSSKFAILLQTQTKGPDTIIEKIQTLLERVRKRSFPEIPIGDIKVRTFSSSSVFFKAQFSIARFFTFRRLKTTILVNPLVFNDELSEESIEAILAHELAHALYYKSRNRIKLFGLVRLTCSDYEAAFERKADLTAISRGYGKGLIEYRHWLYKSVPGKNLQKKQRNYFSPEEIEILIRVFESTPGMFEKFVKKVLRNLHELIKAIDAVNQN